MSRTAAPLESWLSAYELGERLAATSLTVVHRARRRRDDDAVLIKTVRPGLRSIDQALAALHRERQVARAVGHPAFPILLEVIEQTKEPNGKAHFALVYHDPRGHRLVDVLDRIERVAPLSALAIGIELASALGALHRAGFIHGRLRRDAVELAAGSVYVHDAGTGTSAAGVPDAELESPEHMAPEQILGQAAGPETDVFLLGMLVYQLLTGTPPFRGAGSGVTQQIRHVDPPAIFERAPDAPRGLQRILMRCLRKRPRDRYPDVASLQSELVRVLRAHTSLPSEILVSRTLAAAGLGEALPAPRERGVDRAASQAPPWVRTAGIAAAAVALLGAASAGTWALFSGGETASNGGVQGIVKRPARLRVLARPWAEVHIDGELVEITPVGRPIEVSPGRHLVVFKHPNAVEVSREVEIIAGQTIVLDVDMDIRRATDAGAPDASPEDETP